MSAAGLLVTGEAERVDKEPLILISLLVRYPAWPFTFVLSAPEPSSGLSESRVRPAYAAEGELAAVDNSGVGERAFLTPCTVR